jgi:hypothetical protein
MQPRRHLSRPYLTAEGGAGSLDAPNDGRLLRAAFTKGVLLIRHFGLHSQ